MGSYSTALGSENEAKRWGKVFLSDNVKLNDDSESIAIGLSNVAKDEQSTSIGYKNKANGNESVAIGNENEAKEEDYGVALGNGNIAEQQKSIAIGYQNEAKGISSSVFGIENRVGGIAAQLWVFLWSLGTKSGAFGIGETSGSSTGLSYNYKNAGDESYSIGNRNNIATGTKNNFILEMMWP